MDSLRVDRLCGGIGDMQQRDAESVLNGFRDSMHRIGANEEEVCTRLFKVFCYSTQTVARLLLTILMLQGFDLGKVY